MSHRILISGMGSIGQRHLKNLQVLGMKDLAVFDPIETELPLPAGRSLGEGWSLTLPLGGRETFDDYEDALRTFKPNVVFICSPTNLHVPQALQAAQAGCHVFIEKPLSYSMDGITELEKEVNKRNLTTMVGCNMRFHPGPALIKRLIDDGRIGEVLSARLSTGSYLPRWKRERPYRETYSADPGQGGAALDCIHEIDLMLWYLGPAKLVGSASLNASNIGLSQTDGLHEFILEHRSGAVSSTHLNFIQQDKRRTQTIIGTMGTLYWEYRGHEDQKLERYGSDGNLQETYLQDEKFDTNTMYLDELKHFFECVECKKPTGCTITSAREALDIALRIKRRCVLSPDLVATI